MEAIEYVTPSGSELLTNEHRWRLINMAKSIRNELKRDHSYTFEQCIDAMAMAERFEREAGEL